MRDFEQSKHIEIIVFAICWRLSAFNPTKTAFSFSFKFFRGYNWLTNYPDSEFHGHWKTVTLSSISPSLSKHWRFLAFWLSLCFGSCLLFLVCHYTAFLFSTRAMTALGWLPNAPKLQSWSQVVLFCVFWTNFEVFHLVIKHCVECLMLLLKQKDFSRRN